jgi:3-hydroxybutyryl-CoA dehydrogenase
VPEIDDEQRPARAVDRGRIERVAERASGSSRISRVAVVGSGTMGAQIASLAAHAGKQVALFDALPDALERAERRIHDEIMPNIEVRFGGSGGGSLSRLRIASSLPDAARDVDLVIEAVREHIETKRDVFRQLSAETDAILTTNSSSLPSSLLVEAVERPDRLLNTHFFAPIWMRTMLEIMSCGQTSQDSFDAVMAFGRELGLTTAAVRKESKGFIINRIWRAVKRESLRVVDAGVADPEDVDRLWMLFFETKHPPFGIMDMVGLDVVEDIEASYQAVTQDPTDRPSTILRKKVEAGELGEKTGRGFYSHPNPAYRQTDFLSAVPESADTVT